MADEPEVQETPTEPPAPERERDRQGRFVAAMQEREEQAEATEPEAPTEPESQPETADEPSAPEQPEAAEGPSANMVAVARAVGIPDDVIAQASSDAELRIALSFAQKFQAPRDEQQPPQEQIPPELEFAFEWPDEDVPANDPIRKQLERLHEHYKNRDAKRDEDFTALVKHVVQTGRVSQEREEIQRQEQFDKLLDAAKIPAFGESAKLKRNASPEWHLRNENYGVFRQLTEQLGFTPDQAIQAIANKVGHKPSPPSVSDVVRQQAKQRLGGGGARPAPAPAQSREQRWEQIVAAAKG